MGIACALAALALLAGCGEDDALHRPSPSSAPTEETVTITVAPYAAHVVEPVMAEYMDLNPGVRIEIAAGAPDAGADLPGLISDLEAGRPLADVVLVDDTARSAALARADLFRDLRGPLLDARAADFRAWNLADGAAPDGTQVGLPLTIGPVALCFRHDLLAAAGIAQDREELAAALGAGGGGWDTFFELGRRYRAATGQAWFDQPQLLWEAMVGQLPTGYSAPDGTVTVEHDAALRERWDLLTAAVADGLSAGEAAWDWRGGRACVDGSFATMLCPSWMLGLVESGVTANGGDASTGWDVVDALPGGPLVWGADFLAVSASAEHAQDAVAFVDWLTQAGQHRATPDLVSAFPASLTAARELVTSAETAPFFNDAPVMRIFAARSEGVADHVEGPLDRQILDQAFGPVLWQLDNGQIDAGSSWAAVVARIADGSL